MRRALLAAVFVFVAALAASPIEAKQKSIAGDWTLTLTAENFPLHLVFTQKGKTLGGTLDYPHGSTFRLTGAFADGKATFSSDSTGQNFTVHLDATGALAADGTLAGTIKLHFVEMDDEHKVLRNRDQELAWTAARLPKK